jgi:hypothetical protein
MNRMKKINSKPTVAFSNQAAAEKNIHTKITILESALKDARVATSIHAVEKSLTRSDGTQFTFPRSLRQFNLWDDQKGPKFDGLPIEGVVRNSNETLKRYPRYRGRVEVVIASLTELCANLTRSTGRNPLSLMKNQLVESERLRRLLEAELLVLRSAVRDLTVEKDNIQVRLLNLQRLFRDEIGKARAKQATVTGIRGKVTKIRKSIEE